MGLRRENFTVGNLGMPSVKRGAENNFPEPGRRKAREETARECHTRRGSSARRPCDPRRGSDQYETATRPPDSGGSSATLSPPPPAPPVDPPLCARTELTCRDVAGSDRWIAVPHVAATVAWRWHHDQLISLYTGVYIPRSAASSTSLVSLYSTVT